VALLDLEMTSDLDIESADMLAEVRGELAAEGSELWLAGAHGNVRDVLQRSGYLDSAGEGTVFPAVEPAVAAYANGQERSRPDDDPH
jgi:hypothetical protein